MRTIINILFSVSIIWAVNSPALYRPYNNGVGAYVDTDLIWNKADSAVDYRIQIDTSADFSSSELLDTNSTGWKSNLGRYYLTVKKLSFGTSYYWRVKSIGENRESSWSATYKFTTITKPYPYSPSNGISNSDVSFYVIWDTIPGSVGYICQVDTSLNFDSDLLFETDNSSYYPNLGRQRTLIDTLHYGTTYYWRVRAFNSVDTSNWSAERSFKTASAPNPYLPKAETEVYSDTVKLHWNIIEGSSSYIVEVDTDDSFSSFDLVTDTLTFFSSNNGRQYYVLRGLEDDTRYYWRVKAVNEVDSSEWSESFTVVKGAPTENFNLIKPNLKKSTVRIQGGVISLSSFGKPFSVEMFNMSGRKIVEIKELKKEYRISTDNLASGNYFLRQRFAGGMVEVFNVRVE